ncbi:chromatin silencing protein clr2 [Gigaspora margarita]|uniref:Chromatin silencing protein clr2 n=1 Tax=Gigaspora margarita TaxID=4874 RepID=A0A8H4A6M6_GIGMA|nr:chromatin silencing protein clr2 [Gigaspora margarita]
MNLVNVIVTTSGLTVAYSDGKKSTHPTKLSPVPDEKGNVFYFRPVANNEPKANLYFTKLGQELCKELKRQNIKVPRAVLTDLPDGYGLYDHIKQYSLDKSEKSKPTRTDTYLYGNGSKFRSPAEFKDHLLWLASDKAVSCNCKYCGGQTSTTLEAVLASSSPKSSKELNVQKRKASMLRSDKNESSVKFVNMYRCKEIVWGDIEYILNSSQHEILSKKIGGDQIKYWPALVHQRSKADIDNSGNNENDYVVLYVLQPFMLPGTVKLPHKAILPWLAHNPSDTTQLIKDEVHNNIHIQSLDSPNRIQPFDSSDQDHIQSLESPNTIQSPESSNTIQSLEGSDNIQPRDSPNNTQSLEQNELVSAYHKAIALATRVASTYTPLQQYKYKLQPMYMLRIENVEEKKLLQEMESYPHYRNILLGTELLRENDYVRLKQSSCDYGNKDEMPIFKINTIFLNAQNKIQLNGDIFVRDPSMKFNGNVPLLTKLNEENFEYTMDLSEIAGRYYILHHITRSMPVTVQLPHEDRMLLVDEAPKQAVISTGLKKQVAKRTKFLPNKKIKVDNRPFELLTCSL